MVMASPAANCACDVAKSADTNPAVLLLGGGTGGGVGGVDGAPDAKYILAKDEPEVTGLKVTCSVPII